jgi:hypothetical protein
VGSETNHHLVTQSLYILFFMYRCGSRGLGRDRCTAKPTTISRHCPFNCWCTGAGEERLTEEQVVSETNNHLVTLSLLICLLCTYRCGEEDGQGERQGDSETNRLETFLIASRSNQPTLIKEHSLGCIKKTMGLL